MTNSDRLQEIRERAAAATPGPWALEWDSAGSEYPEPDSPWPWRIEAVCNIIEENDQNPTADGEFIAEARSDIPWLLQLVTDQQKEIEDLRAENKVLKDSI